MQVAASPDITAHWGLPSECRRALAVRLLWYKKRYMPSFEANVMNVQQRLGRRLSAQELRLLQMWDAVTQPESRDSRDAAQQQDGEGPPQEQQREGRFKVAFSSGHYEVFFVCSSVLFRGVAIDKKEDVISFLTQAPISLDEWLVKQAIAGAERFRPTQIPHSVNVPDAVLRSMGFVQ